MKQTRTAGRGKRLLGLLLVLLMLCSLLPVMALADETPVYHYVVTSNMPWAETDDNTFFPLALMQLMTSLK